MNDFEILDHNGNALNMELVFSFTCKANNKNYVALNNKDSIFENTSRYVNIDIFELVQQKSKYLYVSNIPDNDWDVVKQALQFNVFAKMN